MPQGTVKHKVGHAYNIFGSIIDHIILNLQISAAKDDYEPIIHNKTFVIMST
jgi:hypothetical protein